MTGGAKSSGHLHKVPTQEIMLNKVSPQSMTDEHLLPAALLEMGDSLNFIEVRKHTLRKEIKDSKLSAAAGKFSGLGAIAGGAALAALSNPLGWLVGGCGLTAYTLSVFGQWLQTGKVHPMPLSSKSQDERDEDLAGQTVSGDGGNLTGRTAIHEDAAYLSDREKTEYELLHFAPQGLMSAMNNVPPAQRWACYQFLVDAFAAGTIGDYANPQTLKDVLGNPSVYSSHLPEASKRFPQYGLPSVETPQTQTESLPHVTDSGPTIATSSPIGNNTRLGAVEVPSSPAARADWKTPEIQSPVTPIVLSKLREVCDRNNSFYVAGSKGSGKGIFASNLLRWKLDQYPNAIALVLDPKGDVKESGYWRHERIRHFAFKGIALSSEDYAEKVIEFLSEARNLLSQADVTRGMRLFLVLDELLTIKESVSNALFAEFRRFGVSAISTGDSEGIHLIAITQSFNAGDSFGSDELLKNFTQVGLFRQDEYTRAKKLIQFGRSNGELAESEFKALIAQSSVGRVMAIAGEFIPTPKAENHSAFDRDTGKIIQQMPLGSNPTEGDILANELNRKIQTMSVATPAEGDELVKPDGEDEEQILIDYVRKKAPIKVREIVQSCCLKKAGITSTKDYQTFLDILVAESKLTVDDEGNYS